MILQVKFCLYDDECVLSPPKTLTITPQFSERHHVYGDSSNIESELTPTDVVSVYPQGDMKPDEAASALAVYDNKFSRIKEDRNNLVKAKEALELADPGKGSLIELHWVVVMHKPFGHLIFCCQFQILVVIFTRFPAQLR